MLLIALFVTTATYWSGLSGGWLFDDYPNIVDNPGVQPADARQALIMRMPDRLDPVPRHS